MATTTAVRPVRLRAAEPSGSGNEGGGVDDYVPLDGGDDGESGGLLGVSRVSDDASGGPGQERGTAAAAAAATESSTTPLVPKGKRDYGMGRVTRSGGGSATRRRRSRAVTAEPTPLGPSRLARKVYFYTRVVCGTIMVGVLITCAAVVGFAPHAPGVNVCNTEFDWVSELSTCRPDGRTGSGGSGSFWRGGGVCSERVLRRESKAQLFDGIVLVVRSGCVERNWGHKKKRRSSRQRCLFFRRPLAEEWLRPF